MPSHDESEKVDGAANRQSMASNTGVDEKQALKQEEQEQEQSADDVQNSHAKAELEEKQETDGQANATDSQHDRSESGGGVSTACNDNERRRRDRISVGSRVSRTVIVRPREQGSGNESEFDTGNACSRQD